MMLAATTLDPFISWRTPTSQVASQAIALRLLLAEKLTHSCTKYVFAELLSPKLAQGWSKLAEVGPELIQSRPEVGSKLVQTADLAESRLRIGSKSDPSRPQDKIKANK